MKSSLTALPLSHTPSSQSSSSDSSMTGYCCSGGTCVGTNEQDCVNAGLLWFPFQDVCESYCSVGSSSPSSSSFSSSSPAPPDVLIGGCCYWVTGLATQACSDTTADHCGTLLQGVWHDLPCAIASAACISGLITSSMQGPVTTCTSCSPSPSSSSAQAPSSSSSLAPKPSPFPEGLCPIFSIDDEEIRGPWENRDPDHNRNLTITQGDTVCYRIAVYENGSPVDLRNKELKSYVKLRFSDYSHVEKFNALLVPGTTNVIELSLSARQTTCLPITELVYSCEIIDSTNIQKVIQGYLRVLPEVTRDASFCTVYGFSPVPEPSSSSSSSVSAECCAKYWVKKLQVGANYIFFVEVPTEEAVYKDISHWEAELTTNPNSSDSLNEVEQIQNEVNPNNVAFGYEMVYPIGNGRYRFIDKQRFITNGLLDSVFSVPIPTATYNNALIRIRHFSNGGCATEWCEATIVNETEIYTDCCPSSPLSSSSSPSAPSSSSSSESPSAAPRLPISSSSSSSVSSSSAVIVAACCLPNGNCVHVTADQQGEYTCDLMGGIYVASRMCEAGLCPSYSKSSSSSSSSAPVVVPMVACCLPTTAPDTGQTGFPSCMPVTNDFDGWWKCIIQHAGNFYGSLSCTGCCSPCSSPGFEPPLPSVAACCLPDGECLTVEYGLQGEYACMLIGGTYNGSETCLSSPCSSPEEIITATCCLNGTCIEVEDTLDNYFTCVLQGGEYAPGTNCTTHPCIQSSSSSPAPSPPSATFHMVVGTIMGLAYTLTGADRIGLLGGWNPPLEINVGDTLEIELVNAVGHPFWIKTVQGTGGANGVAGVTNNGAETGTISWTPTAPGVYYYNCHHHPDMTNEIRVN